MPIRHDGVLLGFLVGRHRYAPWLGLGLGLGLELGLGRATPPFRVIVISMVPCYHHPTHVVHFGCNILWLQLLGVKWAFEYYFVIKPMVQPSRALWYFAAHTPT